MFCFVFFGISSLSCLLTFNVILNSIYIKKKKKKRKESAKYHVMSYEAKDGAGDCCSVLKEFFVVPLTDSLVELVKKKKRGKTLLSVLTFYNKVTPFFRNTNITGNEIARHFFL